jgi:ribosomal protein S18 acetylase RimI-like enzyme
MPSVEATIRRAVRADLPRIGELAALLVRTHHELDEARFIPATKDTPKGYASFLGTQLDDQEVAVFAADAGGEVIGYAYAGVEGMDWMALRGPAGVLHDIVVDPAHRGRGVGRMLLDASLEFLGSRNAPRVVLWTAHGNVAAQRMFAAAGFRMTMAEMTRELTPPPADS